MKITGLRGALNEDDNVTNQGKRKNPKLEQIEKKTKKEGRKKTNKLMK